MQQLADNMVLELSATKPKASSKASSEGDQETMEKIDKVGGCLATNALVACPG